MKLIKKIGSKPESINSTRTKQFGLFECPVCNEHVERPLTHGRRNKSCGNRECRKAALVYNPKSITKKEGTVWDKPYYTNICSIYEKVKNTYFLDKDLKKRNAFVKFFYDSYSEIRKTKTANYITVLPNDGSSTLTIKNSILVHSDDDYIENSAYTGIYEYCCRKLMHDTNCTYAVAVGTIKKLTNTYTVGYIGTKQKRVLKCLLIDANTYLKAVHIIELNKTSKLPTTVYLIGSGKFTKIGITHDINKRLKAINSSNPFGAKLIYCKEFPLDAYTIEQYLHKAYKHYKHSFEWFDISSVQIQEITKLLDTNIFDVLKNCAKEKEKDRLDTLHKNNTKNKTKVNSYVPVTKPKIETVHEWDERFAHDRTNQIKSTTTHGMSHTDLYKTWQNMKKVYAVCDEWQIFEPFQKVVEQEYAQYTEEQAARVYPLIVGVPIGPTNYKIESKYQHEVKSAVAKAVEKLGQNEEVLAEYASVTEAAKAVEGIASKISAVCKGTRKTHAGFNWRYKE